MLRAPASAHRMHRRNAHLGTSVVGVDASAQEIKLPPSSAFLLDEGVQFLPTVLGGGILVPVGLDADE